MSTPDIVRYRRARAMQLARDWHDNRTVSDAFARGMCCTGVKAARVDNRI